MRKVVVLRVTTQLMQLIANVTGYSYHVTHMGKVGYSSLFEQQLMCLV